MRSLVIIFLICLQASSCIHHIHSSKFVGANGHDYWDATCDQSRPPGVCYANVRDLCSPKDAVLESVSANVPSFVPGVDFNKVKIITDTNSKPGFSRIVAECAEPKTGKH